MGSLGNAGEEKNRTDKMSKSEKYPRLKET